MKPSKQSIDSFFMKTCQTGQYKKLTIAFLSAIIWLSMIATSLASTNVNTLEAFNYVVLQSPIENIAPKQFIFPETANLIADATSRNDESTFLQKDPLIRILEEFQKAWSKKSVEQTSSAEQRSSNIEQKLSIKQKLFNVCQETKAVDQATCLELLKNDLKIRKKQLIASCYKKTGSNGKLCLDLTLKKLGIELSDFDE